MADKLLADVNICLDLLLDRKPYVNNSGQIFQLAEKGVVDLWISGLSIDTLFYILRPALGSKKATGLIREFTGELRIAPVNEDVVKLALNAGWRDLEDALHYFSAKEAGCDFLITWNKKDFSADDNSITVATPREYLGK